MTQDEKALEAARNAIRDVGGWVPETKQANDVAEQLARAAIAAYTSALGTPQVKGLVERLEVRARVIEGGCSLIGGSELLREAAQALSQGVSGYVMVPVEPTREMWAAGGNAVVGYKNRHHDKVVAEIWLAMLAASNPPGSPSGWLPIESAPKDGDVLLLLGETIPDSPDVRVGRFINGDDCEELGETGFEKDGGWIIWNSGSDWFVIDVLDPIGWLHLPASNPPGSTPGGDK